MHSNNSNHLSKQRPSDWTARRGPQPPRPSGVFTLGVAVVPPASAVTGSKFFSVPARRTGRRERQVRPSCQWFLDVKRGRADIETRSHPFTSRKVKQRKGVKQEGGARGLRGAPRRRRLAGNRLLASPVRSFLSVTVSFSLVFLSPSILADRISQSPPSRVCQTWSQRKRSEAARTESELLSGCGAPSGSHCK